MLSTARVIEKRMLRILSSGHTAPFGVSSVRVWGGLRTSSQISPAMTSPGTPATQNASRQP